MANEVVFDASQLTKIFDELLERGEHVAENVLPIIGEILVSAVQQQFETEGGGKWEPLADSTLESRRLRGRGAKILQDSGIFAGSIMPSVTADHAEAYTNVPYAIFHTSDEPRTLIPYRNPFEIDEEAALDQMVQLVLKAAVPA